MDNKKDPRLGGVTLPEDLKKRGAFNSISSFSLES